MATFIFEKVLTKAYCLIPMAGHERHHVTLQLWVHPQKGRRLGAATPLV